MNTLTRRAMLGGSAAALLTASTGCGKSKVSEPGTAAAPGYPVSITNCGMDLRFTQPPRRVVSMYPSLTALLLSLGLADRLVGQAGTSYSSIPQQYRRQADAIAVLDPAEPNREQLLGVRPDFIVSDQEYHFTRRTLPTRRYLVDNLHLPVFINSALYEPDKVRGTVERSLADIPHLGRIFNIGARADVFAEGLHRRLAVMHKRIQSQRPVSCIEVTLYDRAVYAHAGGIYGDVLRLAGAHNLVAGSELPAADYYGQLSVEVLARKSPAAIVYVYKTDSERSGIEDQLRRYFGSTPAGQSGRFIGIAEQANSGYEASVAGIEQLANALHSS